MHCLSSASTDQFWIFGQLVWNGSTMTWYPGGNLVVNAATLPTYTGEPFSAPDGGKGMGMGPIPLP